MLTDDESEDFGQDIENDFSAEFDSDYYSDTSIEVIGLSDDDEEIPLDVILLNGDIFGS